MEKEKWDGQKDHNIMIFLLFSEYFSKYNNFSLNKLQIEVLVFDFSLISLGSIFNSFCNTLTK